LVIFGKVKGTALSVRWAAPAFNMNQIGLGFQPEGLKIETLIQMKQRFHPSKASGTKRK